MIEAGAQAASLLVDKDAMAYLPYFPCSLWDLG